LIALTDLNNLKGRVSNEIEQRGCISEYNKLFTEDGYGIYVKDKIHGIIYIPDFIKHIIDTPSFQRLNYIKQLPMFKLIYPGANHTIFSHSLGVYHLAYKFLPNIISNSLLIYQKDQNILEKLSLNELRLKIFPNELLKLFIVGCLCHHIGQPPFSNLIEQLFQFDHQKVVFDLISNKNLKNPEISNINSYNENINANTLHFIFNLEKIGIKDEKRELFAYLIIESDNEKFKIENVVKLCHKLHFPFNIFFQMKNMMNCIFDRVDYLVRDSSNCGFSYGKIDIERLCTNLSFNIIPFQNINLFKPTDEKKQVEYFKGSNNKLDYLFFIFDKELELYESLLSTRIIQYSVIYNHKTYRIIQEMLKLAISLKKWDSFIEYDFEKKIVKSTDDLIWGILFPQFNFSRTLSKKEIWDAFHSLEEETLEGEKFAEFLLLSIFQRKFFKRILTFHDYDFKELNYTFQEVFADQEKILKIEQFRMQLIKHIKSDDLMFIQSEEIRNQIKTLFNEKFLIFDNPNIISREEIQILNDLAEFDTIFDKNFHIQMDDFSELKSYCLQNIILSPDFVNLNNKYSFLTLKFNQNKILRTYLKNDFKLSCYFSLFRIFIIPVIPYQISLDNYELYKLKEADYERIKQIWNKLRKKPEYNFIPSTKLSRKMEK